MTRSTAADLSRRSRRSVLRHRAVILLSTALIAGTVTILAILAPQLRQARETAEVAAQNAEIAQQLAVAPVMAPFTRSLCRRIEGQVAIDRGFELGPGEYVLECRPLTPRDVRSPAP